MQCYRLAHGDQQLQRLWPALRLGLFSSLLAYLAQLFTPLPGLQQMACFLMLGLIGAWLSARLWLPHWPQARQPGSQRALMRVADWRLPARWQGPLTGLVLLALPLLLISAELRPDNDLRQLNPSPRALIQEQQQVAGWLQQVSGQRFVLLSADQDQALLQRLEQLDTLLGQLQADGELSAYDHLARRVPSLRRQQTDHAQLKARYAIAVPDLLQRAGLPPELATDIQQTLSQSTPLLPQDWLDTAAGQTDQSLWWRTDNRLHAAILLGDLSPAGQARLLSHLQADEIYHDRVTHLGNTLGALRDSVSHWLLVACLCLLPLLLWRYRRQAWRALLPPFGAVILALALLGWLGQGITLFHLLGLLLVLGIGLDSGIFNAEHGQQAASWLAITLSCASSLIAFGLLSLSSTPALHQLGLTCLIGLASVWGLTLISRPPVTTKET